MAGVTAAVSAVTAVAGLYSSVKSSEASEKAQKKQKEALEDQQQAEKDAIADSQAKALDKRKQRIDTQRKQVIGGGAYSIGQTGDTGIVDSGESLTGGVLG